MSSEFVFNNEVGPRDGLQNQKTILDASDRLQLINLLINSNLPGIEVASFVNPKAVPAMEGAHQIMQGLMDEDTCEISVLVPNLKGFELARDAGAKIITVVPSATETMNQKNINMSLNETISSSCKILKEAKSSKLRTRAYVSVAWECPYEGKVDPGRVSTLIDEIIDNGVDEIVIADTIGAANPLEVKELLSRQLAKNDNTKYSVHFHDTKALALSNIYASLEEGISKFDSSIGGLGGCPFAPGASGNLATEDLVGMLYMMNLETGIDLDLLHKSRELASELTALKLQGRMPYSESYT